jgi:hypothetical protein
MLSDVLRACRAAEKQIKKGCSGCYIQVTPRGVSKDNVAANANSVRRGRLRYKTWVLILFYFCAASLFAQSTPLYENNFQNAEVGKVPENVMVLEGGFAVKQEGDNKYLELPGAPLDSFAVLFGPTESSNVIVSAGIAAASKGRRFPTFGVGLNGVAGYRLQVSPAKKVLELYKDQQVKASVPYEWKSGEWTLCRLQVRSVKAGEWIVEGKVSADGKPEPAEWMIRFEEKEEPIAGRASLFGSPFSGEPIKYDDLMVRRLQ